jgi:hypothetical protein
MRKLSHYTITYILVSPTESRVRVTPRLLPITLRAGRRYQPPRVSSWQAPGPSSGAASAEAGRAGAGNEDDVRGLGCVRAFWKHCG